MDPWQKNNLNFTLITFIETRDGEKREEEGKPNYSAYVSVGDLNVEVPELRVVVGIGLPQLSVAVGVGRALVEQIEWPPRFTEGPRKILGAASQLPDLLLACLYYESLPLASEERLQLVFSCLIHRSSMTHSDVKNPKIKHG